MNIKEIQQAITQLSERELTELVSWLDKYQRQKCDEQKKVHDSLNAGDAVFSQVGNLNPDSISISDDFNESLPDIFWAGKTTSESDST